MRAARNLPGSFRVTTDSDQDPDVHDPLVRVLRAGEGAPRREGPPRTKRSDWTTTPSSGRRLRDLTGGWTVPQIVIDGQPIGGYTELWRLDRDGSLDELLAA